MKRFGAALTLAFLGSFLIGCEGGLKEGPPAEIPKSPQTEQFKGQMAKDADKMKMKRPKSAVNKPEP
jgi:hypothetical protein